MSKPDVKDNEGDVVLQPDQSAVIFDANGDMSIYFPKRDDSDPIDDGAMAMLRVAVFLGDTTVGRSLRAIADMTIEAKQAVMDAEEKAA